MAEKLAPGAQRCDLLRRSIQHIAEQACRLRTIILSAPLLVVTSLVLYQRLYQGKEQKKIAGNDNPLRHTLGQQQERR